MSKLLLALMALVLTATASFAACADNPSACGYPDTTNTGPNPAIVLKKVPQEVTSGPGWFWDPRGWIVVNGSNALVRGIEVKSTIAVHVDNAIIEHVRVAAKGETFGIAIENNVTGTIIRNAEIGAPIGEERLLVGIKDIRGGATGTRVLRSEFYNSSTAIQIYQGVIRDNYIHTPGFKDGDHINGITSNGSRRALTIEHNTILNPHNQTDAIGLFEDFGVEANRTIENNLMAGGGYTLYAGQNTGGPPTYNIKVTNNRFSRLYYPNGGYWGPVAAYCATCAGNLWTGNVWDDDGSPVNP